MRLLQVDPAEPSFLRCCGRPVATGRVPRAFAALAASLLLAAQPARAASVDVLALGSDGKPLPETVVFLESPAARTSHTPLVGRELAQADRRFAQRVTVLTVGSELKFPNLDKVRHHVYSFSPAKTFELKLYTGAPSNPVLFDKPGIAVLGCNIHDAMVAWVVVVETPHHGTVDARGQLRLDNVPPGTYRLRSWNPALPPGAPAADEALTVVAAGNRVRVSLPVSAGGP